MLLSTLVAGLVALTATHAAPVDTDASSPLVARAVSSTCPKYTIISTRGTSEAQGPSAGFRTMNSRITSALSGGTIYNTVYPASFDQNSAAGTADIIRKANEVLAADPNACLILEGYSQGAAATVNAMPSLTGATFNAVKGVFLIGDPLHKAGLACNVDQNGGTTTKNAIGISASYGKSIPTAWVSKTLDVCIYGDGVCDSLHGAGITYQHLTYGSDSATQTLGTNFVTKQLGA